MILREKLSQIFYILSILEILWSSTAVGDQHRRKRYHYKNHNQKNNSIRWHDWYKPAKRKDTNSTSSRAADPPSETTRIAIFDWVCLDIKDGFMCAFCDMSILCADYKAYQMPCTHNTKCSYRAAFQGAVCHTDIPPECQCSGRNEIIHDPYNHHAYQVCFSTSKNPEKIEMCPVEHEFDRKTSTCKRMPDLPDCKIRGTFPLVSDCRWYHHCDVDSKGKWKQTRLKCLKEGTFYSAAYERCVPVSFLSDVDPCVHSPPPSVVHIHHHHPPAPAPVVAPAPAPAPVEQSARRYVCTLFGLVVTYLFPGLLDSFCARVD